MTEAQFNEYCPTIGKSSNYIRTTLDITNAGGTMNRRLNPTRRTYDMIGAALSY
jgi:hypothetical protein